MDSETSFERKRHKMVARTIARRGIHSEAVLRAMRTVPRERFIEPMLADKAYKDRALPIDKRQTISQPFIVAKMAEAAEVGPTSRVLEIGTGSGYGAAVLSELAEEVWTIERHRKLADQARSRLAELGYGGIHVIHGDGAAGCPEAAPFDAVVVTAAAASVPTALVDQLVDGGRLIMPIGDEHGDQQLQRVRRTGADVEVENLGAVRFVPLVTSLA